MIAFKYLCETQDLLPNTVFARLLGIKSEELQRIELSFLDLMDFKAYVSR
jgi:hypothetical protein